MENNLQNNSPLGLDTADLSMQQIAFAYNEMYFGKDYDWWTEIQPGGTVVDIGAGIGLFSKKALDAGAGKVLMIEPNKRLLIILTNPGFFVSFLLEQIKFFISSATYILECALSTPL